MNSKRDHDSTYHILESLVQTRRSLEVKQINAMIENSADQNEQELEKVKYDIIRNSLEFQMNQVLQDVEPIAQPNDTSQDEQLITVEKLREIQGRDQYRLELLRGQ